MCIRDRADCEAHGLVFDVVESIPVSEDIKLGTEKRDTHLEAYCENVRPVSYTHLDVYKRQVLKREKARSAAVAYDSG